jgi:hypothetical protein
LRLFYRTGVQSNEHAVNRLHKHAAHPVKAADNRAKPIPVISSHKVAIAGEKMKKALACLSLTLLSLPALAVEWKLISETEDTEKVISWYVDMSTVVHEDDYMRAVLRTSWSVPQYAADGTAYQSSTYLNYFDCDTRRIAYTSNAYFTGADPEGKPVHSEPEKPLTQLKFQKVVPGSAGETRLDFVCKFRSKNFLTRRDRTLPQG